MDENKALSRRSFLAGAAGSAGLAVMAAACGGSTKSGATVGSGKKSTSGDTITVALSLPTKKVAQAVHEELSGFTKSTGIKVNLLAEVQASNQWPAVFQQLSTRIAGGLPVDTAYIPTEGMQLFEEAKALLEPLGSYIQKDASTIKSYYDDISPSLLAKFRALDDVHGDTYFLPCGYNLETLWYNRKLFKSLGIKDPDPNWTWEDFEKTAHKLSSPPNRYAFAMSAPTPNPFLDIYPWVLTAGGYVLDVPQTKSVAGSPEAIEAATFARSLVASKLCNEPGGSFNYYVESFAGRVGMFSGNMGSNASIPASQADINKTYAQVPWPKNRKEGTPIGLGGFPIFKSSPNKDAVWEFIKYSISTDFQSRLIVPFADDTPVRLSVSTDKSFLSQYPPGTEYLTKLLPDTTFIVGVKNSSAIENEIAQVWEQILSGSTSPASGMKSMEARINQLLTESV